MIKAILFDLDGVIVEAKIIHYKSLNDALPDEYKISWRDHLSVYDGLKTNQKLEILTERKGLLVDRYATTWENKQRYTEQALMELQKNEKLIELFNYLKTEKYKIAVCSNSIRPTILMVLKKFEIESYVDLIISNQDVSSSKPHPEMYWKAMIDFKVNPENTLIFEDSPHGLLAAHRSNAKVYRVKSPSELHLTNFKNIMKTLEKGAKSVLPKWVDKKLNIVIPMAGAGSRFAKAGFTFPKPLIEVKGKPMTQVVIENLNIIANYIFIVQSDHLEKYHLDTTLNLIAPGCKIVEVNGVTEGAACTVLLAKEYIDNSNPVFFANSDQFVEWNSNDFFYKMNETKCDGGIPVFKSTHPKWSFIRTNDDGNVVEVQEKNPISDKATVGFYYFKEGKEFVRCAEKMINNNDRVNGEFYLCPVYNYLINDGGIVKPFEVKEMWGLGTPEDLDTYLKLKAK